MARSAKKSSRTAGKKAASRPAPRAAAAPTKLSLAKPKPKPSRVVASVSHRMSLTPTETRAYRELFWQNVLREVLVSLIMLHVAPAQQQQKNLPKPPNAPDPAAVLDGRLGLITKTGLRIPIAGVYPVFSASVPLTSKTLTLSAILQSTVFQVHTPSGEVYTLPLHEIRGFHALTEELMDQLAANARAQGEATQADGAEAEPFGFAAFTSMARGKLPADMNDFDDNEDDPAGAD
ncbi:MAG TPA: hypothetical protein VK157_13315 [Phycisphaerales bacterium]|nr:hypothetical protein [Phycisphaerales bacterium]